MRVDRLHVERGRHLDEMLPVLPGSWRPAAHLERSVVFVRESPRAELPGSISWHSQGLTLEPVGQATAEREVVRIRGPEGTAGRRIVFARTFWPGYRATLRGQPIPVRVLGGFLVGVDLPSAVTDGELVLSYEPPGLGILSWVSALSLVALLACGVMHARLRRLWQPVASAAA
jgi:hypothetical protein